MGQRYFTLPRRWAFWSISKPKANKETLGPDPPEVKIFRILFELGMLPRACCDICGGPGERWGHYERTDCRLPDGRAIRSVPIPRYRCKQHGCFSSLPSFLARYLRYLSCVVDQALLEYAGSQEPVCRILAEDGPSVLTIGRWVRGLLDDGLKPWLVNQLERAPALQQAPDLQAPRNGRPSPWQILCLGVQLARGWNSDYFSPFLQRARLASR